MKELDSFCHVDPGSWHLPEESERIPNLPMRYIIGTEVYAICGLCARAVRDRTSKSRPHSILILAIFQHLCECFLGILPMPSLFLHYYYSCRVGDISQVFAGGYFRIHNN